MSEYSPYKMKGSPMYRNYGIGKPPKGTTEPTEGKEKPSKQSMESQAKLAGVSVEKLKKYKQSPEYGKDNKPVEQSEGKATPAKFFKKLGKAAKFLNPFGGAVAAVKGMKALKGKNEQLKGLEERVTALEGGGEGEAAAVGGEAQAADPAAAAAAEGGDPKAAKIAALKAGQKGAGGPAGIAGGMISGLSDIRAKEKIQKTGISASGIPIYEFNYIGSEARYSGTMAQDLLKMGVDAVSMHEDGYYRVNYNNIDVDMRQIN